jgi:hypothetical protein
MRKRGDARERVSSTMGKESVLHRLWERRACLIDYGKGERASSTVGKESVPRRLWERGGSDGSQQKRVTPTDVAERGCAVEVVL